jgi:hypothetical protein
MQILLTMLSFGSIPKADLDGMSRKQLLFGWLSTPARSFLLIRQQNGLSSYIATSVMASRFCKRHAG